MNASILVILLGFIVVVTLLSGRRAITKGLNSDVARGAVLLTIAVLAGIAALLVQADVL